MGFRRTSYPSVGQKRALIGLMRDRDALIAGRFTDTFTRKDAQKEWEEIANILNAIPGATKGWTQWRKTFQDFRVNAKRKRRQAALRRQAGMTTYPELSADEEDLLESIGGLEGSCGSNLGNGESESIDVANNVIFLVSGAPKQEIVTDELETEPELVLKVEAESGGQAEEENYTAEPSKTVTRENPRIQEQGERSSLLERKLQIKEAYYKEKLSLMRDDISVKTQILQALVDLKSLLKDNK